jgi:hypothetical protein
MRYSSQAQVRGAQNQRRQSRRLKKLDRLIVLRSVGWCARALHAHVHAIPSLPKPASTAPNMCSPARSSSADHHAWLIEVERVWKGHEKLARTIKLMDVYATMDCEFFFHTGQRYVFFAILAKGGRDVFYHPQACNWTRPLQSTRVSAEGNGSLWLEDFITREYGPGQQPRAGRP